MACQISLQMWDDDTNSGREQQEENKKVIIENPTHHANNSIWVTSKYDFIVIVCKQSNFLFAAEAGKERNKCKKMNNETI